MAKNRMINTRFWSDSWIVSLDPTEKLLFLYLLTNERTNLSGIYELPLRYMAVETGIDREMVERILARFENDGKVQYIEGWICLKNFQKYQNKKNPSIKLGIKREMSSLPTSVLSRISNENQSNEKGTTRIPLGNEKVHLTKPNLTKPNLTKERTPGVSSLSYLRRIPEEDSTSFLQRFDITSKELWSKAESLFLYCEAKGKTYKNYRAFLLNALKKDFRERMPTPKTLPVEVPISNEQRQKNLERLREAKRVLTNE